MACDRGCWAGVLACTQSPLYSPDGVSGPWCQSLDQRQLLRQGFVIQTVMFCDTRPASWASLHMPQQWCHNKVYRCQCFHSTHPAGGISDYLVRCRMSTPHCLLPAAVATCILPSFHGGCGGLPLFWRRIPAARNYHLHVVCLVFIKR